MEKTVTKADIVQRLLESKHITAEEAVVLLMNIDHQLERKNKTYVPPLPWFGFRGFNLDPNPYTITATNKNNNDKDNSNR